MLRYCMLVVVVIATGHLAAVSTCGQESSPYATQDLAAELSALRAKVEALKGVSMIECCEPAEEAPPKPVFPIIKVGGFFQADAGWFNQDATSIATVQDVQDGADFRRARLQAYGDISERIGYQIEMDFAFPGRPSFMDVWTEVRDVPFFGKIRLGQYRVGSGLDAITSVRELTFLERGLPFALIPFRQIGIGQYRNFYDDTITVNNNVFRYPTDFFGGNVGDNGGFGFSNRTTALLVDGSDRGTSIHVGGNYVFADPSNDQIRFAFQPEFFVTETPNAVAPINGLNATPAFVNTGFIASQHYQLFGAELASTSGPIHAEGEAMFAHVTRDDGSTLFFPTAYAQVGWILTGEHRPYNKTGSSGNLVADRLKHVDFVFWGDERSQYPLPTTSWTWRRLESC